MKVGLVVLDGWALNPDGSARDAVAAAHTPNFDRFRERGAAGTLVTHGRAAGLPAGQMGNSEVGHLTIGAGRVVDQESTRITDAVADGSLGENDALRSALSFAGRDGGRLHVLGLISDGGVHSYQSHVHALVDLAAAAGVEAVTHAFTDGRDTDPRAGADFLADLAAHADAVGTGDVATVTGRYYAMDRDGNWDRTKRAYDAVVRREAPREAPSAVDAVERSYERGETDEFVEPTLIEGGPPLRDGDAAVFANFRADRARQLTRVLTDTDPTWVHETDPPDVRFVTMTEYDETFDLPVAFPPSRPTDTLGEVLASTGSTQLRIAETEKYAHVTYFLNGGREVAYDGEVREIVPSPDVPTYDERPEMSAPRLTDTAVDRIESVDPAVAVVNYANPDMVGHTGDFEAAVAAVEAVDAQLGRLVAAIAAAGGHAVVTADHGNADDMGTSARPHTAHTTNPVPFVALGPAAVTDARADVAGDAASASDGDDDGAGAGAGGSDGDRGARDDRGGRAIRSDGTLADVAPTVLSLAGIDVPDAMTGVSLLE